MLAKSKSLAEIKSDVCNTTLWVMSVLVVPALALSISRAFTLGWQPQFTAQIVSCLVLWGVTAARHRLPYVARANTIVVLLFWLGWLGQIVQPIPTTLTYFVSASAMTAVFYGARGGVIAIAISALITLCSYFAFRFGLYPTPLAAPPMMFGSWLSRAASIVVATAGPVIAVSQLRASLSRALLHAEAVSEAKSNFLAMMSHELRTPMTAIIGIAELLQSETMPEEHSDKVDRIAASGKSLMGLLNDLLDFAKIEANQMTLDQEPFSLSALLDEISGLFTPMAKHKGLALTMTVAPGAHDALVGDSLRIRQIVQNLVGNAIKFTERGRVTVEVSQSERDGAHKMLRIAVSDTGIGIHREEQARLFQPFVQGEDVASRKHSGTGLGLAISRQLAELMSGSLTVSSTFGAGSTFTLELPVGITTDVAARPQTHDLAPAAASLRVLVVDDNEPIRHLMLAMLTKRGHVVELAENGAEAVSLASSRSYDLILMDMHMPVMDGMQATMKIRALDGPQAHIPIIALTAGLTESQRARYLTAGVDHIAAKPAHWPSLFATMEGFGRSFHESMQTPRSDAVLDTAAVDTLQEAIGEGTMSQLLTAFRASVDGYNRDLQQAVSSQNIKAAKRAAHGLKGTCMQFGALELGKIAAAMDKPETTLAEIQSGIAKMAPAVARLDSALASRAQQISPAA